MARIKILFAFFLFSLIIHVFFFLYVSFELNPKQRPQIDVWVNALDKNNLWSHLRKEEELPERINLWPQNIQKKYFSKKINLSRPAYLFDKDAAGPLFLLKSKKEKPTGPFFLWEKETPLHLKQELASYRALISPQGKIILLYPQKLAFDHQKNIVYRNYLKESAYFFEKDFFWTNFKVLVE